MIFTLSSCCAGSLLLLLSLSSSMSHLWPPCAPWLSLVIICLHIGVPLWALERFGYSTRDFNLYAYNLEALVDRLLPSSHTSPKPDYAGIKYELKSAASFLLPTLIFYILGFYLFFYLKASQNNLILSFNFTMPSMWGSFILGQIFAVALPEEFFYRGFLQRSLQYKLSPMQAIILTNIIFALAHFINNFEISRLLTFFPGLIFSYLVYKYKSLLSAVLFHAACNLVGQILALSIIIS